MAESTPPPETPSQEPAPLDQAPLSEFVTRRAKGETSIEAPPAPPAEVPDSGEELPDDTPIEAPPAPDEKAKPPGKPKSRYEERLGVLTRQRHDAERALESERQRAARLEAELQEFKRPAPPAEPAAAPGADGQPPNLDQYLAAGKTYEDWMTALIDFRTERQLHLERQRAFYLAQQQEMQAQMAGFGDRTEAAKQKYPDYEDVVISNDRVQLSPVMQDIARRSPNGPDIMYWLGTHEAEANQLGELTRNYPQASYPLVEAHLLLLSGHSSSNGTPGAKRAVSVSQAPAPITPVGGGTTTAPVALDQAPLGEFVKRRNAEIQKKRSG